MVGTFLEWSQNNIRNVEMVCSITVITNFNGKVLEKFLILLEKVWDINRILYETFYLGVGVWEVFYNCSKTVHVFLEM